MGKLLWKPGTMLYPVPVVLIGCGDLDRVKNLITIAWAGTIASEPAMVSIAVRPERYSYQLLKDSGEFTVNLPNQSMVRAVDLCGVKSGKDGDKFQLTGLTPERAETVKAPAIKEAPLVMECKVDQIIQLGSHDLFLAKVTGVAVEDTLVDQNGALDLSKADLITYVHGRYWTLKEPVGNFGFSVKKPRTKRGAAVRPKKQ
jgi:flavin reductase (DIM6/NTAB) family NADH-FMN oxidoreductase RutF